MDKDMHDLAGQETARGEERVVVAGRKAPTVTAQTERRDRKVVAAVTALARQKSLNSSRVSDGLAVTWHSLSYTFPPSRGELYAMFRHEENSTAYRKKVMMNVSGYVKPGQFLAVMGPEGSGKSLLLHILAGRMREDPRLRGAVQYNGRPFSPDLRRHIGFVDSDVHLLPNLTVKETLVFAAQLRLPESTEDIDRVVRVEHVLDSLELTHCADVVIGSRQLGRHAMQNEQRRLAIGVQMIMNPPLLLLDEPTSGLDGAMALRITRALNSYAVAGRSVVATMKQPSVRMFNLFTHLLLLSDGNPLYFGAASQALSYFDTNGFSIGPDSSPAEFFLDLTAPEATDASIHFGTTTNLIRLWAQSDAAKALDLPTVREGEEGVKGEEKRNGEGDVEQGGAGVRIEEARTLVDKVGEGEGEGEGEVGEERRASRSGQLDVGDAPRWVTSWGFQFRVLALRFLRSGRMAPHDRVYGLTIALSLLLCALLTGCLWFRRDPQSAIGIRDQVGLIYFLQFFWGLLPMLATVITFQQDRRYVKKEQQDGVYHLTAYYAARTLLFLPFEILPPLLFNLIAYWMTGLNPYFGRFVLFTLVLILDTMVASSMGLAIGTFAQTVVQAIGIAAIVQLLSVVVVHFLVLNPPAWIGWTQYLSFSTYVFKLLVNINFPQRPCQSSPSSPACSSFSNADLTSQLTLWPGGGWLEVLVLLLMLVAFRLLALAIIKVRLSSWRWKNKALRR